MLKETIVIIGTWFQKYFVKIFVTIYGIELILAPLLYSQHAAEYTYLLAFSDYISTYIPAIHSFDKIAKFPEGMRIYIMIFYGFLLIKVVLGVCFCMKRLIVENLPSGFSPLIKHKKFANQNVPPVNFSPRLDSKVTTSNDSEDSFSWFIFIVAILVCFIFFAQVYHPIKKSDSPEPPNTYNGSRKQRSWFSIIFFSLAIWGLGYGSLLGFRLGFPVESGEMISGGFMMWLDWSLLNIAIILFITLAICILIEWVYYFYLLASRVR